MYYGPPPAQPTVLVIDDDPDVRGALALVLELEGYRVLAAEDGEEGLRAYREGMPDVVITDIVMPRMTGLEVIAGIKRVDPAAGIIAISGGSRIGNDCSLETATELGASAAFAKPFHADTLLRAVQALLSARSPAP